MAVKAVTLTLEDKVISYIERQSKIEGRNLSNFVNTVIKRYQRIMEQLDQGARLDLTLRTKP